MRREAVKLVADAIRANLQTKLDALSVVSGESAPEIAEFRDEFNDAVLDPVDLPSVRIESSPEVAPQARFESFGRVAVTVPMQVVYVDADGDTEKARHRAAYAERAITQVLNDLIQGSSADRTANSVSLINLIDLLFDYGLDDRATDKASSAVLFGAHMEDTAP